MSTTTISLGLLTFSIFIIAIWFINITLREGKRAIEEIKQNKR